MEVACSVVGLGLSSPQGFSILRSPKLGKRMILALFATAKLYDAHVDEIGQCGPEFDHQERR